MSRRAQADALENEGPARLGPAIVGIGASAGGLSAMGKFFERMSADSGLAFVIVIHLDPNLESHAAEVLAHHTKMQVLVAQDGLAVEPNRVYVIVPDRSLIVVGGVLHLHTLSGPRGSRRPVDTFLDSLAADQETRAIGIIFSGTGTNGTSGMRSIKAQGGMTIVQDPDTAEFDGMPQSAISAGAADYILAPEAMPEALLAYSRHPYMAADAEGTFDTADWTRLNEILAILHAQTGHNFRAYKRHTLSRRIHRRMGLKHVYRLHEYASVLRTHPEEIAALVRDLMINVTGFFRDPAAWEVLRTEVVAPLIARRGREPIRAWVPACATGEEAYSLAMLLLEEAEKAAARPDIKVFATDASADALAVARVGLYPASVVVDVPEPLVRRFFDRHEDTCQTKADLREHLVFAPQNLLQDPPFSKLDVVSCRNLLIYLETDVQKRVLELLHFALRDGGYLFLGGAETVGRERGLFESVARKARIYRRVGPSRRDLITFPLAATRGTRRGAIPFAAPPHASRPADVARQALLDRYAPAGVLVDRGYRVLHFQGSTHLYLTQPTGEPTIELLTLARPGLRIKLRAALERATKAQEPVTVTDARVERSDGQHGVILQVFPVRGGSQGQQQLLVTFREERAATVAVPQAPEPAHSAKRRHLEGELQSARDDLRTSVEDLEASNEELRAANEEIVSINEELQASNEELETSKEELQSLNEELSTVNSQLQEKVGELEVATNDLANLLANAEIATLFLDTELRIGTYTPATARLLDILPTDMGRPLSQLAQKFTSGDIVTDAKEVLAHLVPVEREAETTTGRWYLQRTLPYRTRDNRIEGVVVTFHDITRRKHSEEALAALNQTLERRVEQRTEMVRLLHEVASAANEARTVQEALALVAQRMGSHENWDAADAWLCSDDSSECVQTGVWCLGERTDVALGTGLVMPTRLGRGEGLAGWVMARGEVLSIPDVRSDPRWRREDRLIQSAALFPVVVHARVQAVLGFYAAHAVAPDPTLFTAMANVVIQLGHVLERRQLEREIVQVAETEQQQIGSELHDRLGQDLYALGLLARSLQRKIDGGASLGADGLTQLVQGIEAAKAQVRLISQGVIPTELGPEGLTMALEDFAARSTTLYGIDCRFENADGGTDATAGDTLTMTQLFRITQEAVRNAVQHGEATRVVIELKQSEDQCVLDIRDNGKGFPAGAAQTDGIGLRIMRHRAALIGGELAITSSEEGTVVRCSIGAPT